MGGTPPVLTCIKLINVSCAFDKCTFITVINLSILIFY
jgi:hypothetical protein